MDAEPWTLPAEATVVHKFGMEFHALLTADGLQGKKKSKLSGLTFHPIRPWAAAVEDKDFGLVWNYETKEVLKRFSLTTGEDAATPAEPDTPQSPGAINLSKTFSPKLGGSKTKATATLLFFDRDAIAHASGVAHGIECYEEYLVVFSMHHILFCDLNGKTTRLITPDELQRATPTSIETLPGGFLAIGCSDSKVRVYSPRMAKVCHVIDTGLPRDVSHMVLIPSTGGHVHATPNTLFHSSEFHCFLTTINAEGKAIVWSLHHLESEFQQSRASEFDTKQASGFLEVKLLRQDGAIAGISKDGHVLFYDVSFLLSSRPKQKEQRVTFAGGFLAVPTAIRPTQATLFLGSSKNNFVLLQCAQTSLLFVSDLNSKGKPTTPNGDVTLVRADVSKDVRTLHPKVPKKLKINTVVQCPRDQSLIGCATNHGLLLFKLHHLKPHVATMMAGLPAVILSTNTHLRTVPLLEKAKKELYALKYATKESIPVLRKHPSRDVLAILAANGANFEARARSFLHGVNVQVVSVMRDSQNVQYQMVTHGPGQAIAWHHDKLRYALLATHEAPTRRMTRSASAAVLTTESPRRKLGFFSKADDTPIVTGPQLSYFYKNDVKSLEADTSIALYDIVNGVANVLVDRLALRHPIVHIFSGPLLGVVYCILPADDKPASPKAKPLDTPTASASMAAGVDEIASVKFHLELYQWDAPDIAVVDGHPSLPKHLTKVGETLQGPLFLEWDKSGVFCVLVYARKMRLYRYRDGVLTFLHRIACARPVVSVLWVHMTLFVATNDDITSYFFCGSRSFSFLLASAASFNESANPMAIHPAELPVPQQHPGGGLQLLGVVKEQLYMTCVHQCVYSIDLTNEVLQFCMFVAQGSPAKAVALVPHISLDLADYLATYLDAFGFGTLAVALPTVSIGIKANLCIKHNASDALCALLPQLLAASVDSDDILGTSLFQRSIAALVRRGIDVDAHIATLMLRRRFNDALYVALVAQKPELVAQALAAKDELSVAVLRNPNKEMDEGLVKRWQHALDVESAKQAIAMRPPEVRNQWD